jgi:hypothetical protein
MFLWARLFPPYFVYRGVNSGSLEFRSCLPVHWPGATVLSTTLPPHLRASTPTHARSRPALPNSFPIALTCRHERSAFSILRPPLLELRRYASVTEPRLATLCWYLN